MAAEHERPVVISSPPVTLAAGPFEFRMLSRRVNEDHGGTLEVYGRLAGAPREVLKFDCFEARPHWHRCYPDRPDEITPIVPASAVQALHFTMATLRTQFGDLLAGQSFAALSPATTSPEVATALAQVETTMAQLIADSRSLMRSA